MKTSLLSQKEEKIRLLLGIARLHTSIAKEIMSCGEPLSYRDIQEIVDLLKTANEAKHLAHKIKSTLETKITA